MRLVQTLVSETDLPSVESTLDDYDVDYVLFQEDSGRDGMVLVEFPLPTQAVESILEDLRAATDDEDAYTVVVSAETVSSEHIDELEERFITGTEEDDSIPTEEIRSKALDMTPNPQTYYSMTVFSALVATAGLLLDSPAIVVGSMVIAPLVGSALTASVGTVINERSMILEGFKTQIYGLSLAVFAAVVFSFGLKSAAFLPPALDVTTTQQISQRISPGLLSVVVGICAGAAGGFGLATGVSVTLVGVMIAAALIPAAAAVGIGIAWGIPAVALGATLLLVLNAIAIHVAGASVLWYLGYRPSEWGDGSIWENLSFQRSASLVVTLLVLGALFVGTGAVVSTHITFEQQVNQAVGDIVTGEQYGELELVTVRSSFNSRIISSSTKEQEVTVVVGRPADREYAGLSGEISRRIESETGREVEVIVEFVERQTYNPGAQESSADLARRHR